MTAAFPGMRQGKHKTSRKFLLGSQERLKGIALGNAVQCSCQESNVFAAQTPVKKQTSCRLAVQIP